MYTPYTILLLSFHEERPVHHFCQVFLLADYPRETSSAFKNGNRPEHGAMRSKSTSRISDHGQNSSLWRRTHKKNVASSVPYRAQGAVRGIEANNRIRYDMPQYQLSQPSQGTRRPAPCRNETVNHHALRRETFFLQTLLYSAPAAVSWKKKS
jgi:hypothetical protein